MSRERLAGAREVVPRTEQLGSRSLRRVGTIVPTAVLAALLTLVAGFGAHADFGAGGPWFVWRIASPTDPVLGITIGSSSRPALVDLDGDHDLDLVVGTFSGSLSYLENTGSRTQPVFTRRTGSANPFDGFLNPGLSSPTFGDLDADGDQDLLVGDLFGGMQYLRNTGSATAPVFTVATLPTGITNLPEKAAPALVDLDQDGDLDLFVGGSTPEPTSTNVVYYYFNKQSPTTPAFADAPGSENPIQNATLSVLPVPAAGDLDRDGDVDVLVGDHVRSFSWWENRGTPSTPGMTALTANESPIWRSIVPNAAPALGDLDGDGDLDIVSGRIDGQLDYFEQVTPRFFAESSVLTSSAWSVSDGAPIHLIDGSGLVGTGSVALRGHDNNASASTMWHAGPLDGGLFGPTGNPPLVAGQTLIFDLFTPQELYGLLLWNHNQLNLTGRGINGLQIFVSSDSDPFMATFTNVGTWQLERASGLSGEPAQRISFQGLPVQNARLVKLVILSAQSGLSADYVGLSEVRFVPEPGAGTLLSAGAIVLAGLARRSRSHHRDGAATRSTAVPHAPR